MYSKIILLGITSKVCSAETSGNTDRTVTREDETKPPLLSAKWARLTVGSSGRLVPVMTVPLLLLWGVGGRGGILSGYGFSNKQNVKTFPLPKDTSEFAARTNVS